jgi:hypothetical protein
MGNNIMRPLRTALLVAAAIAMGSANAYAAAKDYRFELVGAPAIAGTDAEITDVKFDMGPAGMAGMAAPAKAMPAKEPGSYMIETQPSMAGAWGLTLTAKVKSEAEPVRGTVVVTVPK